ncbi:MAG: hypothetical protein P8X68_22870 [Desulfobacterales bacterium]
METEKIKLNTVIISILVIAVIEIIARLLINKNLIDSLTGLGFARLVEIFLLLVVVAVRGKGLSAIGLKANGIYRGFIKGLIWAVSFGLAAGAILFIIYLLGIKLRALFQMNYRTRCRGNIFSWDPLWIFPQMGYTGSDHFKHPALCSLPQLGTNGSCHPDSRRSPVRCRI